jgi:hypothetical protein
MRNDEANLLRCHCDDSCAEGTTNAKQAFMMWSVRALWLAFKDSIEMLLNIFGKARRNISVFSGVIQVIEIVAYAELLYWEI